MKKLVKIGLWCKRAAWIILIIGLVESGLAMYTFGRQFVIGQPLSWPALLQILQFGLAYLPGTLFYFCILSAAAAVITHFAG